MTLVEAIQAKAGKEYSIILAELQAETVDVVGRLTPDVVPEIKTILSQGFRRKLNTFTFIPDHAISIEEQQVVYDALQEGFEPNYLNNDRFVIHLGLAENRQMLSAAVILGIITSAWEAEFIKLATVKELKWPSVAMRDIVEVFNPELLNVTFSHEIGNVSTGKLCLDLEIALPEASLVRIDMSESLDGIKWSEYKRVNHFYNVHKPDLYFATIPTNAPYRKVRVTSEVYEFTGTVKEV